MKSNALFLLVLSGCILLSPSILSAQSIKKFTGKKKSSKITSQKAKRENFTREDDDCVFTNKYTPDQRRKMYPFAQSASILAVAYKARDPDKMLEDGTIMQHTEAGLWIKDGVLDTTTLLQRKKLTLEEIDELSKLLFNTDYKRPGYNIEDLGKCYEPVHFGECDPSVSGQSGRQLGCRVSP